MNVNFDQRQRAACDGMVEAIAREVRETRRYTGRERLAEAVMAAMASVPRHCFVPDGLAGSAYLNQPLPIGHGQTISQPYIVALMTDLIAPSPERRVLEIGTGCGYQTAVLSTVSAHVYSLDVIAALSGDAARRLRALGLTNVDLRVGDGWQGWQDRPGQDRLGQAPFDAILVTAAASRVPPALLAQLAVGGRMAIPVGPRGGPQSLYLIEKVSDTDWRQQSILPVAFVPLVGDGE